MHLQAFAGIVTVSVGHCHPRVAAAIAEQNRLLQHTTTIYLHHQVAQYAKELTDRMPGNLKVCMMLHGTLCLCCAPTAACKVIQCLPPRWPMSCCNDSNSSLAARPAQRMQPSADACSQQGAAT